MKTKPLDKIEFSEIDDDSFLRYSPFNAISIILYNIENDIRKDFRNMKWCAEKTNFEI